MELLTPKLYKPKKGANCEKNYWVDLICKMTNKPFKQMCGLLNHLRKEDIKDLYEMSKSFEKNPAAYFWKLLRKTRS